MLNDEIKKARMQAMKEHKKNIVDVLSIVTNKTMLFAIEKRKTGEVLTDTDVVTILQKTEKELIEEQDAFRLAKRDDTVAALQEKLECVRSFLPTMMTRDEIVAIIATMEDKSMPSIMKRFKSEYAGKCDMRLVNEIAKNG